MKSLTCSIQARSCTIPDRSRGLVPRAAKRRLSAPGALRGFAVSLLLLSIGCASSGGVDLNEPRRVLGRESDVRIDAQIFQKKVGTGTSVRLTWEIENLRSQPIAVADMLPSVSYDELERTLVVQLGSEVPGNNLVPRLIRIESGEKRAFNGAAKINLHLPLPGPMTQYPRLMQVRVSFLSPVGPFEELIGIPETSVADPALADRLFPQWLEANETIRTNSIPIDWMGLAPASPNDASRRRY
ncbi:MAG TPA: hypothetical protein VM557_00585 [Thermoanaerobaculia bacterium]|nr:hypothetical protein [Thermoanaerobaculia bacterium]